MPALHMEKSALGYRLHRVHAPRSRRAPCYETAIELAYETWGQLTTSFVTPAEVRIRIGPLAGIVGVLGNVGVMLYFAYVASTTNVYMQEKVPAGLFSHWGSDSSGAEMQVLGEEQMRDGSLCTYNKTWDYYYGLDNIWDYSGMSCDLREMGYVSFKDGNSLHFITYEQRRQIVTLPKVGDNCDDECQSVYPNWPTTASFGTQKWKAVHVNTELFENTKRLHPSLPNELNVRMKRPNPKATSCECLSLENVFLPGAEKLGIEITHRYTSEFATGSSKEKSANDPTSFLMTETGKVFKTIEKGNSMNFTVEELMSAFDTCMDCQPSGTFSLNSACSNGVCTGDYMPKPTPRLSGTVFNLRTEFYSHKVTMPKGEGYDYITAQYDPPYAVHIISHGQDWTSRGNSRTTTEESAARVVEVDNYRYGTLIKINTPGGVISSFDATVLVSKGVEFMVLAGLPTILTSFVAFYCLGHKSKLLRQAQRRVVSLGSLYRSFTYNAILAQLTYKKMDEDLTRMIPGQEEDEDFFSEDFFRMYLKDDFFSQLRAAYPDDSEQDHEQHFENYLEMMVFDYQELGERGEPTGTAKRGITKQDFMDAVLDTEPMTWQDMVDKLRKPDVDKGPGGLLEAKLRNLRRRKGKGSGGSSKVSDSGAHSMDRLDPDRIEPVHTLG
mmetsp:Transcript_6990/g.14899  ORF Transcript_6990/g.14899 Transcript_6990/m.14899 type:complete len:667 (-) Transcript_6990:48-2048(-)